MGAKPIFKRAVDVAEILGQARVLVESDLALGDAQALMQFIGKCNSKRDRTIQIPNTILAKIRTAAKLIKDGTYDPDTRPPPHVREKRSEAAVQSGNIFAKVRAKKTIEAALKEKPPNQIND